MYAAAIILAAVPGHIYAQSADSNSAATSTAATIYSRIGTTTPVETSGGIETFITSVSPQVARYIQPVLGAIDTGRVWVAQTLERQIVATTPKLPGNSLLKPGAGEELSKTSEFNWQKVVDSVVGVLWTIYFFLLVIIRFAVAKLILCYPLLVVACGYLLVQLYRRIVLPRWAR